MSTQQHAIWIKYSKRMPSDDDTIIIKEVGVICVTGLQLRMQIELYGDPHDYEWIPYTEEICGELNE